MSIGGIGSFIHNLTQPLELIDDEVLFVVRIWPLIPPATQRLLPNATEKTQFQPKFDICVTQVIASVLVRILP